MTVKSDALVGHLLALAPVRPGPDFFSGESPSVLCLDTLLNQRVGVERATAVNLAVHNHFGRPFEGSPETVSSATACPYSEMAPRPSAKTVLAKVSRLAGENPTFESQRLADLESYVVGALASLERYYRRDNPAFDVVRKVSLSAGQLSSITSPAAFNAISRDPLLGERIMGEQLRSASEVLRLREEGADEGTDDLRNALLSLPRVGKEAADTLLVYAFGRTTVIVDTYLRRIGYRHFAFESERVPERIVRASLKTTITSRNAAANFHARVTEIGEGLCRAEAPDCARCPLRELPLRLA